MRPIVVIAALVSVLLASGCTDPARDPVEEPTATVTTAEPSPEPTPEPTQTPDEPPVPDPEPTAEPTDDPTVPGGDRATATVILTIAEWNAATGAVEVVGYADVFEQDGRCELTVHLADSAPAVSGEAFADVTTTSCGLLAIPGDRLEAGSWTAELTYSSSTSVGSATAQVVVP